MSGDRRYSVAFSEEPSFSGGISFFAPSQHQPAESLPTDFEDDQILDTVRMLDEGNFLLSGADFSDIEPVQMTCAFVPDPDGKMAYGREESTQEVEFGQLLLSSQYDKEKTKLVAVKPFETARGAVHEYGAMSFLNGLSPPPNPYSSFKPLGFCALADGKTGLITEYDESVISYDNTFWDPDRAPTQPEVQKAVGHCGLALGYIHALGAELGDSEVKNFASDNQGVRFIDLVSTRFFPASRGRVDAMGARRKIEKDMRWLFSSLTQIHPANYTDEIVSTFIPTYVDAVERINSRLPSEARLDEDEIKLYFEP